MSKSSKGFSRLRSADVLISAGIFAVLYALLAMASPIELSAFSINNLIVLATTLAIAAAGTTLTLIIGGFDLSVAGTISLTNVIAATAMAAHPDRAWIIAGGMIALGLAIGAMNGFLIVWLGLPSLGVTLGTYIALSGIALVILPAPGGSVPPEFYEVLTGPIGPVPLAAAVLIVLAGLWVLFTKTRTGMSIFAIGGDLDAARLSGIPVKRVQIFCFILAGGLYACAGLYFSAVTATGSPSSGDSYLLATFAAAAIGLVSFRGGRGSIIAAIIGAGILTIIPKLLFAVGFADFWVGTVQGVVILLALAVPLLGTLRTRVRAVGLRRQAHRELISQEATTAGANK